MKLRFRIIDRSQKGVARYCPTFAKPFQYITRKIETIQIHRIVNKLKDEDTNVRRNAAWALRKAAEKTDISAAIPALVDALKDRNVDVRGNAADALVNAAMNENSRDKAIAALIGALKDEDGDVRRNAAWALGKAAANEIDISTAIAALGDALKDENVNVRENAAETLRDAAKKGMDISAAIPALGDALKDEDGNVRWNAAEALENAVTNGNYETVEKVIALLQEFVQSRKFMLEMNKNSPLYIEMFGYVDKIMAAAQASEEKWARLETGNWKQNGGAVSI
jgi:HEAT repeat protein